MFRSRRTSVCVIRSTERTGPPSFVALALAGAAVLLIILLRPAVATAACDRTASPGTLASRVEPAKPGQTICLKTGDYGTWTGTAKRITLRRARASRPTMNVSFGPGDSGFTLNGMSGMGGTVRAGAHDFTIRNSTFTSPIDLEATDAGILLDHNRHDWNAEYTGFSNAKIFVWNPTEAFSGVTVRRSTIRNGNLDGIHLGGAGINVVGNTFANLCDTETNHTDNIQYEGGRGGRIARNYVYAGRGCNTQGITSYDGGTIGVTIEDNVVDIRRPWGIELYSDRNSVVRHNTVRWYPDSGCVFTGIQCGQIDISRKSEDPAGSGTQVYDNLATRVNFTNGSTGTAPHNVSGRRARFVGPLRRYSGFRLHRKSRLGRRKASDRTNVGARIRPPRKRASTSAAVASRLAIAKPPAQPAGVQWQPALVANALLTIARVISGIF
jgi:hypothetical protein